MIKKENIFFRKMFIIADFITLIVYISIMHVPNCIMGATPMYVHRNRGSYMSAPILLNLYKELEKKSNVRLAEHFIAF